MCSSRSSISQSQSRGMAKQVKSGFLLHYKKRFFGKDWREVFVILFADSTILWFRDRERASHGSPAAAEGAVVVREAPHMLAAGKWTSVVPQRPEIRSGGSTDHLMAIGTRHKDKVHWFLCKDVTELNTWMTAISNTLPPPPPQGNGTGSTGNGPYIPSAPSDLPPTVDPVDYRPPPPPAYIGSQGPLQQGPTSNNTTVIVQDRTNDGYNGGLSGAGTGFAAGVLTGSLLSGGWGVTGAGPCWGLGYGWGGGWGLGYGGGCYNHNLVGHTVNNYYDNDTTTIIHNQNPNGCGGGHVMNDDDAGGHNDFGVDCDASAYDGFDAGGFDFIF